MKNETITKYFSEAAAGFADKVCLQMPADGDWQRYTFAQTEKTVKQIAAHLEKNGIGKGDFVMLILENCPEWAFFYLGILYSGACAVPIDKRSGMDEIENIAQSCGAKGLVISQNIFSEEDFPDIRDQFESIIVKDLQEPVDDSKVIGYEQILESSDEKDFHLQEITSDDYASLIYTSGTTGEPKGVLLSHGNFCHNVRSMRELKASSPDDSVMCLLPLFHAYAFMGGLLAPLLIGARVTFCPSFKSEVVTGTIRDASITLMTAVPEFYEMLRNKIFGIYDKTPRIFRPLVLLFTKRKVRKLLGGTDKRFVSGGAKSDPQMMKDLARLGFEMNEGYGLTETAPIITLNPPDKIKHGSPGKPLPEVEVKISNPDENGTGEIIVKGPNVMQGYYKMPEKTDEVIKDGWFHTGDMGTIDEDGYLYITGRLNEMIVLASGKNIYPAEIEKVFAESPYIQEVCIIKPEDRTGLHAVVYPDMHKLRNDGLDNFEQQIKKEIDTLSKNLQSYKHVQGITIAKQPLPRTRLGKLRRFEVQEQYGKPGREREKRKEELSESDKKLMETAEAKQIMNFLRKQYDKDTYLDDNFEQDLGIDSLGRIELVESLEGKLNKRIPDDLIENVFTVRELITEIANLQKQTAPETKEPADWESKLSKSPPPEKMDQLRITPTIVDRAGAVILSELLWLIFRVFGLLRIKGKQNLPRSGPYILCPNHNSYFDPFIVAASLPQNQLKSTFFIGYSAIIEHPSIRWSLKFARMIPISSTAKLSASLQIAAYLLRNSKIVCIFPEGRRSPDQTLQPFKKGASILAKELDVPLVPVSIEGTGKAWPVGQKLPKPAKLKITYGKPITASELLDRSDKESKDDYQNIADALREEVLKL